MEKTIDTLINSLGTDLLIYASLGMLSGILAGLLGIGGGIIIVPVLAWVFRGQNMDADIIMHLALGSSLATIVITSIGSMRAHHKRGSVVWEVVLGMTPGIILGALLGAFLAHFITTFYLQKMVAVFIVIVGMQMLIKLSWTGEQVTISRFNLSISGALIGFFSSLAGIGGGSLTTPYLVWHKFPMVKAIATSSACGFPIALSGALGFMLIGWEDTSTMAYTSGYLYWPAISGITIISYFATPIGVKLAHRLPVILLKRIFSILLIAMVLYFFQ